LKIEMKRLKRNSRVRKSGKTAAKASQRMLHIINDGSPTKKKKKKKWSYAVSITWQEKNRSKGWLLERQIKLRPGPWNVGKSRDLTP